MKRLLTLAAALLTAGALAAQAVPEGSQAARTEPGWFRVPSVRFDPFRNAFVPHWGFVFTAGGYGENNTLNFSDLGALMLLNDNDSLVIGDAIDAMGLLPRGAGASGVANGDASFYLGGPIGPVSLSLTAGGRAYGAFQLDDQAVALLRDGNGGTQQFSLGTSAGAGLATAEAGVHLLYRTKPIGSVDGVRLTFGAGARYVRPVVYGHVISTVANGGRVLVSNDSIVAHLGIEFASTPVDNSTQLTDAAFSGTRGSGFAKDFVFRAEWPTNGLAFEAMLANLGTITVDGVERQTLNIDVASTSLDTVINVIDSTDFVVRDTTSVQVTLPRILRFGASAWANRFLQLNATVSLPVKGEFQTPTVVEVGSTWRFIRTLPLRAGLIFGRTQGLGYTAGVGVEGRSFLFRLNVQSLGGFMKNARGAGGQLVIGTFF